MRGSLFLFCLFLLFLGGCERKEQAAAPSQTAPQAQQPAVARQPWAPTEPVMVELPPGALPTWAKFAQQKPALVLLSHDPLLRPIPEELRERARMIAAQGDAQDLDRHGSILRPEPLILSSQTVSAALSADFFSKIYWVFPSKVGAEQLELERFRQQTIETGFLTPEESQQITLENGTYSGLVRGIPFSAIHYAQLPRIDEPLVLHIDLSFFRGLYDNEIRTPLYDLIHQTANSLRAGGWQPLATTLSWSTLEGDLSLDTRFVLSNLGQILQNPALLDQSMPRSWELRAEALYAADMFSESKKLELYREAAHLAPEDPTVIYDLFQVHLFSRQLDKALIALDEAVERDPGYGAAYLGLVEIALVDGNLPAALRLLEKAQAVFPLNPFIAMHQADLYLQLGEAAKAEALLSPLRELPWSHVYHAEVPALIDDMLSAARNPSPEPSDD